MLLQRDDFRSRNFLWLVASFGLFSAILFLLGTHQGIGILPDSTRYMQISPVPYDAPLYAWLVGLGWLVGITPEPVAYAAGLLLYVVNTILIIYILNIILDRKVGLLALATLLVLLAPQFIRAHIVAMSEPLFLCLVLTSILLLVNFLDSEKTVLLVASGLVLGLAMLTRFTAAPFGLAFVTTLLVVAPRWKMTRRWRYIIALGLVSGSVFALWATISKLFVGRAVGRSLAFNGNADGERWLSGLDSLSAFIVPLLVPQPIRYVLLTCFAGLVMYATYLAGRRVRQCDPPSKSDVVTLVFGLSAAWYLCFLLFAVNVEANLPINGRYLLPVYLAFIVVLFSALSGQGSAALGRGMKAAILLALGTVLILHAVRSADDLVAAYRDGVGYQGPKWRNSAIVHAVKELPQNAEVFSNAPDAINFLTGRQTKLIPTKFERRTGVEDPDRPYIEQVAALRSALQGGNGYVIFLDNVDWRFYLASEEELRMDAGLHLKQAQQDGRLYSLEEGSDKRLSVTWEGPADGISK